MNTFDVTTFDSNFVRLVPTYQDGPCRHFGMEMDGDLKPWACEPEFICTNCRERFSRDLALAIRDMHESQL